MQLILGVQPKTLQNEPQMRTPSEKIKHEPTVADTSEKCDLHLFVSWFSPCIKTLTIQHSETVEAQ